MKGWIMEFMNFPSINQYRNTIKWVRKGCEFHSKKAPVIPYVGTVKLHGTNAAIVRVGGKTWYQSRNRVLTIDDDNAGFAARMSQLPDEISALLDTFLGSDSAIFGEWCGQGIQRGVAISELPKMFVIFAASVGHEWVSLDYLPSFPDSLIFKVTDFPTFNVDIDFDKPEIAQTTLGEITLAVEQECPVGKHFGITGMGEGVVWRPADMTLQSSEYWFKVKGEKHSVSRVKTLAPVDVEMIARRDDLIAALVTENRLNQGLDYLSEQKLDLDMPNIGTFLRWVFNDVVKEDADTIVASGFTVKELGSSIAIPAKRFFMAAMNERIS
jgi:hypothetical protein